MDGEVRPTHGVDFEDRDHRLEAMLDKITKEDEGSWLSDYLDKLKQVITMLQRQLRKATGQLKPVAGVLQRLIDTCFVEYVVEAISRVFKNSAAVNVLHELRALGSIFSAGAHDAPKTIEPCINDEVPDHHRRHDTSRDNEQMWTEGHLHNL